MDKPMNAAAVPNTKWILVSVPMGFLGGWLGDAIARAYDKAYGPVLGHNLETAFASGLGGALGAAFGMAIWFALKPSLRRWLPWIILPACAIGLVSLKVGVGMVSCMMIGLLVGYAASRAFFPQRSESE